MSNRNENDQGFTIDPFLSENPLVPTFGLNITIVWPFPNYAREPYQILSKKISMVGNELYVYPYKDTHITISTIIDFTKHINPSQEYLDKMKTTIIDIKRRLELCNLSEIIGGGVTLSFESILLSNKAIYITFFEPENKISKIRKSIFNSLKDLELDIKSPNIIHSTVARFISLPTNNKQFYRDFEDKSRNIKLPNFRITDLILTSELQPYMQKGEALHRYK